MGHVFKHPKYYEELRKKGREEKEASSAKQQAIDETVPHCDIEEAASSEGSSEDLRSLSLDACCSSLAACCLEFSLPFFLSSS